MRAWLVTWMWMSPNADLADEIAAILPPRWSSQRVADVVEQAYAVATSNVAELAAFAKHPKSNPYRVTTVDNQADMLECGHRPWLYARKVTELNVTIDADGFESVSWREPDRYKMNVDSGEIAVAHTGQKRSLNRVVQGPLLSETVRDRASGKRKSAFVAPAG